MNEQFQCCDCFHIGALNIRGACEECGSQAVISQELIELKELARIEPCPATA